MIFIYKNMYMYSEIKHLMPKTKLSKSIAKLNNKKELKNGVYSLKEEDIDQCLALQDYIISELEKTGDALFIIKRNAQDYKELINNSYSSGFFINGVLVGQTFAGKCKDDIIKNVDFKYNGTLFEVKGTMVHPKYRGQKISQKIKKAVEKEIEDNVDDKCLLVSEVATNNDKNKDIMSGCLNYKAIGRYVAEDGMDCTLYAKEITGNKYKKIVKGKFTNQVLNNMKQKSYGQFLYR